MAKGGSFTTLLKAVQASQNDAKQEEDVPSPPSAYGGNGVSRKHGDGPPGSGPAACHTNPYHSPGRSTPIDRRGHIRIRRVLLCDKVSKSVPLSLYLRA